MIRPEPRSPRKRRANSVTRSSSARALTATCRSKSSAAVSSTPPSRDSVWQAASAPIGPTAVTEAAIARAEAAQQGQHYEEARAALAGLRFSPEAPELELRALLVDGWVRMYFGEPRAALELLARARELAELDICSDVE